MRETRAILLDIEGTTTPVDFVYQVLFPYARRRLRDFLTEQADAPEVRADRARLSDERAQDERHGLAPPAWRDDPESAVAYLSWLMDRDRKSTALKSIQGKIWEAGYLNGELLSEVFPDVPAAFARWSRQQKVIAIFSSGSVLAQKLLFAHTTAGDLTRYLRAYFDTTTGPKKEAASYEQIAAALALPPAAILFLSDVTAELNAAKSAGMSTALCLRPGNAPAEPGAHPVIRTFDEISP
jgi:enolase-phosphatase E1